MIAIGVLLLAIGLSLIITRTAAVMLELTGMSRDSARFQARAAYCGVGSSGLEMESIITHPVRRQIISQLMMLGNAGTATVVATIIISFTKDTGTDLSLKIAIIGGGLLLLLVVSRSKYFDYQLTAFVQWSLKRFTRVDLKEDYTALLHLTEGFSVLEVEVQDGDWLGGRNLATLALPKEGIIVLGIRRPDGTYIGTPTGNTGVDVGDTLTVYGRFAQLEELNHRKHGTSGMYAHLTAVTEHKRDGNEKDEAVN